MAETNDPMAHLLSLNYMPNSVTMLNGQRYHQRYRFESNQYFRIPEGIWDNIKDQINSTGYKVADNSYTFMGLIRWYLKRHFYHQIPRILTLLRYYEGDNDIHYWKSNKIKRADNRIADNYPRFITDFDDGMYLGKPLKYGYQNANNDNDNGQELLDLIDEFNSFTDSRHHDFQIGRDMLNTGRAYELEYIVPGTHAIKVTRINPNQCFVIWSTDVDPKELCAVRYTYQKIEAQWDYQVEVYTDDKIFQFDAGSDLQSSGWTLESESPNVLGAVPITEYKLNDDRMGKWEPELDDIDALDVAMSEMANSQEDFSNATAVISGAVKRPSGLVQLYTPSKRPLFYEHGYYQKMNHITTKSRDDKGNKNRPVMVKRETPTDSNVLWLMPSTDANGNVRSQPTIKYLTKELDVNEWSAYINEIKERIERFCGVPLVNNKQSSGGNQNELAVRMHVLSAMEGKSNFETNFRHGVIRRISLMTDYYTRYKAGFNSSIDSNDPNDISIQFNINLPLDIQGTAQEVQLLTQTGIFSKHTMREVGSKLTGVSADEETSLVDSENSDQQQSNMADQQSYLNSVANANGIGTNNALNNVANNSDVNSQSSNADNHATSNELKPTSQSNSSGESSVSNSSDNSSNFSMTPSQAKQSSADSTGNSIVNSTLAENANDPQMDDNDLRYMNQYVDSNGSVISFNNARADDMLPAMFMMDSLYGNSGFPSGFDSVMSNALSAAMTSSMAGAFAQSATDSGNNVSDGDSDNYSDSSSSSD